MNACTRKHLRFARSLSMRYHQLLEKRKGSILSRGSYGKLLRLFSLLFFAHVLLSTAMAQATITALEKELKPLKTTSEIKYIRYADVIETPGVQVGMSLSIHDELRSPVGAVTLEVVCRSGSILKFSGPFRVVFEAPNSLDCAFSLLNGNVDVLTNQPTSVMSANARLAQKRTQYAVSVSRTDRGPDQEWIVYEGEVEIQTELVEKSVDAGKKLLIKAGESPLAREIEPADVSRAANVYARLDVSQWADVGDLSRQRIYAGLQVLHAKVLGSPKDVQARISLARAEMGLGNNSALLNLNLAESFVSRDDRSQLAIIADLKGNAYVLSGKDVEARAEYRKAVDLDPSVAYRASVDKALADRGRYADASQSAAAPAAPASPGRVEGQAYLFELVRAGRYREAVAGFERILSREGPNSRNYYGLSLSYAGMGDMLQAARVAREALETNRRDHRLSEEEQDAAKKITAAANK